MATKVYLRKDSTLTGTGALGPFTDPDGNIPTTAWGTSASPGAGLASINKSTVNGPVAGRNIAVFISPPLAAAVTISGTITYNWWGFESAMAANAGFQGVVKRLTSTGTVGATVSNKEFGTELGTAAAVNNWTDAAPTSTAFSKGDRILIIACMNDAGGTMASGNSVTLDLDGATGAADGDTYVQFNETITFASAPAGTTFYLTDTASDVSGAGEKAASTSRGSGSVDSVTTIANGPVAPTQVTATAGGTALEWFSPGLSAFTLAGMCQFNIRAKAAGAPVTAAVGGEVAICAADGSGATVWGSFNQADRTNVGEMALNTASDNAMTAWVSGVDTAVTNGQRLRFRIYLDDSGIGNTAAANTPLTVTYNGTSSAAAGDTFVTLPQSVTSAARQARNPAIDFANPAFV